MVYGRQAETGEDGFFVVVFEFCYREDAAIRIGPAEDGNLVPSLPEDAVVGTKGCLSVYAVTAGTENHLDRSPCLGLRFNGGISLLHLPRAAEAKEDGGEDKNTIYLAVHV